MSAFLTHHSPKTYIARLFLYIKAQAQYYTKFVIYDVQVNKAHRRALLCPAIHAHKILKIKLQSIIIRSNFFCMNNTTLVLSPNAIEMVVSIEMHKLIHCTRKNVITSTSRKMATTRFYGDCQQDIVSGWDLLCIY